MAKAEQHEDRDSEDATITSLARRSGPARSMSEIFGSMSRMTRSAAVPRNDSDSSGARITRLGRSGADDKRSADGDASAADARTSRESRTDTRRDARRATINAKRASVDDAMSEIARGNVNRDKPMSSSAVNSALSNALDGDDEEGQAK